MHEERFTKGGQKVMDNACEEAQRFRHEYIGVEHVLLGLIRKAQTDWSLASPFSAYKGESIAVQAIVNLGVDPRKIRLEMEKLMEAGPGGMTVGKLPRTSRTAAVIALAISEAQRMGDNRIGSGSILLGLLREQEGVAARVLIDLGLTLERVRREISYLLGHDVRDEDDATVLTAEEKRLLDPADGSLFLDSPQQQRRLLLRAWRKQRARIADLEAVCAVMVRWFDAEEQNLGTFHDKMNLCKYTEWAARRALGQDVGEFSGVPRLLIVPNKTENQDETDRA